MLEVHIKGDNMKISVMVLGLLLFFVSCSSQKMIEGTSVKDTDDNRVIYDIMMKYNKNLEEKNVDALMKLVSNRYYDGMGTIDSSDDYGYSQLRDILEKRFAQIKEIFQIIKVKKIIHNKSNKHYYVVYQYDAKFLMNIEGNEKWHKKIDTNQITLVKEGKEFKIIKGL